MVKKNNKQIKNTRLKNSTYRINIAFYHIFYACYHIVNRDQLSDYLIFTYYEGGKDIPKRKNISQGIFLKYLFEDFYEWYQQNKDVEIIFSSKRALELREYFREKGITLDKPRRLFPVRIPNSTHNKIKKFAKEINVKVGEVVEFSIAYHLYKAPEVYYDLITFVIQYQFKEKR